MQKKVLYIIPMLLVITSIVFFKNFFYLLGIEFDGIGVGVSLIGIEIKIPNEQVLLYQISFIVIAVLLLAISVFSFLRIKKINKQS